MDKLPFNKRFGLDTGKIIDQDFPVTARNSLLHLLDELKSENAFKSSEAISREILRVAGLPKPKRNDYYYDSYFYESLEEPLHKMEWWRIFDFIERIYEKFLTSSSYYDDESNQYEEIRSQKEVKEYFSAEINQILSANGLVYQFIGGQFQRGGRAQTQKSIQRVGSVLADPKLLPVRRHYSKALQFFNQVPSPDVENCSKEAICALESCLEVMLNQPLKEGFPRKIKQIKEIPPSISESMIKIYAYRGDAAGVAHGTTTGSKISLLEAELLLSLIASYITYLVDVLAKPEDDVPF